MPTMNHKRILAMSLVLCAVGSLAFPVAAASETARVDIGVPVCDAYFTAFEACVRDKVGGPERGEFLASIEAGSRALKRMTTLPNKLDVGAICLETQGKVFVMLGSNYGWQLP